MNKSKLKSFFVIFGIMGFFLVTLIFLTGFFGNNGEMYSFQNVNIIRTQSKAMLEGHLAVSDRIEDLGEDMVWYGGKVQQVWGLGVPFFYIPFALVEKMVGAPFPDRFVFIFFLFSTLSFFFVTFKEFLETEGQKYKNFVAFFSVGILLFLPPFLSLLKSRFTIYEEVIAYGYVYYIFLLSGFLRFYIKGDTKSWLILSVFCGVGIFIRPTLLAYGMIFWMVANLYSFKKIKQIDWIKGNAIFVFLLSLLFFTNFLRFGNPLEFGHSLTVASNPTMINSNHFGTNFKEESTILGRSMELIGELFLIDEIPKNNYVFNQNLTYFQVEALRWRNLYFPTFHLWNLFFIFVPIFLIISYLKKKEKNILFYLSLVSVGSFCLLFLFYVQADFISSRYLVDFAGCFTLVNLLIVIACAQNIIFEKRKSCLILFLLLTVYISYYFFDVTGKKHSNKFDPGFMERGIESDLKPNVSPIPSAYIIGDKKFPYNIPFNGRGWNSKTGKVRDLAMFIVKDPDYISLRLKFLSEPNESELKDVKLKINNEFLNMEEFNIENKNAVILFSLPKNKKLSGYQTVFASFGRISTVVDIPNFILEKIEWKKGV